MPRNLYSKENVINYFNIPQLYEKYKGPVWVYESETIIKKISQLRCFDIIRFAQKSCSNIHILEFMRKRGIRVDSVSIGEIERALLAGFKTGKKQDDIIFTSDIFDDTTIKRIIELDIQVNIGSMDMLSQLGDYSSPNHRIWLRINPGFGYGHSKKTNTGGENSKHGIWYEDIPIALEYIDRYRFKLIGFHMHIGSGVNYSYLSKICDAMVKQVISCKRDILSISVGGGLPIPYQHGEKEINVENYFNLWEIARKKITDYLGHSINIEIEPGRFLIAESGILISKVKAVKKIRNKTFILVDAGFNDLVRPAMYGSYHHISLLSFDKRDLKKDPLVNTIIAGPLCESGDVFTQNSNGDIVTRLLPKAKVGDYVIFHDTGAYGSSMSSNYNTRVFLPEVFFLDGVEKQIRRRQTLEEIFSLEL